MNRIPPDHSLARLFDLNGKVALITGGSRGLGLQLCEALGEYGASVILSARKPDECETAVTHLAGYGIDAHAIPADLSDPAEPARLVEAAIAARGRVDILVNNAGTTWGAPAEDHPLAAWNKVVGLNLTATFLMSQAVAKHSMIPGGGGAILNIASVAGLLGMPPEFSGTAAYNASKGGVVNLTRALAAEWGRHRITVNAIAPGFFPSKMTRASIARHEAKMLADTPLGKLGGEADLKGAALLFCSAAGGHITGQILAIDGGASVI